MEEVYIEESRGISLEHWLALQRQEQKDYVAKHPHCKYAEKEDAPRTSKGSKSVAEWYRKAFPSDSIVNYIPRETTFDDILRSPKDIYDLTTGDSLVRERIFDEMVTNRYDGLKYDDIYQDWLNGTNDSARKVKISSKNKIDDDLFMKDPDEIIDLIQSSEKGDCKFNVDVNGLVNVFSGEFVVDDSFLTDEGKLKFKLGVVKGDLSFEDSSITSLEGCPTRVNGRFCIANCKNLKSLKGAPQRVGHINAYHCGVNPTELGEYMNSLILD